MDHAAAAAVAGTPPSVMATHGDVDRPFEWASVTKIVTAYATLVAVEEGTVTLDDGLRRLLSHAVDGKRRAYTNESYERVAALVAESSGMPFAEYAREAVLDPLGMRGTDVTGSPAAGAAGPARDLAALACELLAPALLAPETLRDATAVQFPGLAGVLPGFGRQDPNDWGLGFELRDAKSPHWTGSRNSPSTFGHFGRSGTFLWVDPDARAALVVLTDREFGDWAKSAWPAVSDATLAELASAR